MIDRRKLLLSLGVSALIAPFGAFAQQPKIRRFGFLGYSSRQSFVERGGYDALTKGLRDLGYVEGKNFVFEDRYADGVSDRIDGLAAELVRLKVDLILSQGTPAHHAAQRATSTIKQPTRYYLEINRKTANVLGVRMPQELLMRADKVIE